ncbi:unnamed protein product [Cladocopium goreaui]|uniref:AP-1 complex subunit gamma-1 n=1 Tax=Cladocopium goreaui TaxID=2562237 RepID=A0A9P1DX16_9DINO|nr:unnamed protein product [Cladocopium goreaui]
MSHADMLKDEDLTGSELYSSLTSVPNNGQLLERHRHKLWQASRLLCCEVVPQALAYSEKPMPPEAITLFIATSEQILLQDNISCIDPENHSVTRMPAGLIVPRVYFSRLGTSEDGGDPITKNVLRDFAGLENMDEETTAALLNFSYHLACGNTDEAYKSVKGVRSSNVWESMSKMCVKTGRLDVAQKCLGQMSHARAAGALRQCPEQEPEARLAVVAVHLDMIDDADAWKQWRSFRPL